MRLGKCSRFPSTSPPSTPGFTLPTPWAFVTLTNDHPIQLSQGCWAPTSVTSDVFLTFESWNTGIIFLEFLYVTYYIWPKYMSSPKPEFLLAILENLTRYIPINLEINRPHPWFYTHVHILKESALISLSLFLKPYRCRFFLFMVMLYSYPQPLEKENHLQKFTLSGINISFS